MDVRLTYRGKRSDTLEARRLPATRDRSHREFPAIQGGFEGREKVAGHRGRPRSPSPTLKRLPHAGDCVPGAVAATFL